jgi:hypothetical protein
MEAQMRNTGKKFTIGLFVALSGLAIGSREAQASDPGDIFPGSTGTSYFGDTYIYECSANGCTTINTFQGISPSGDVDYIIAACGYGKVTSVQMFIAPGGGDLDLAVYKFSQTLIGSSTGVGSTETVNTSAANLGAVIVKVYGYNGATGSYGLTVSCG